MQSIKPPQPLKLSSGNISESWAKFSEQFGWYIQAIDAEDSSDARKIGLLLTVAGPEAQELFRTFAYVAGEDKTKYKTVLDKFKEFCNPKKNEIYERFVFRTREQNDGEPFEQFLTDLRNKADSCAYGTLKNSLIRDQIVVGIRDIKMKEKLLRTTDLTLEKAVTICLAQESTKEQLKLFTQNESAKVNAVRSKPNHSKAAGRPTGKPSHAGEKKKVQYSNQRGPDREIKDCSRCGYSHPVQKCPAWGKTCAKCKGTNHFASKCRSKKVQSVLVEGATGGATSYESESEDFFLTTVNQYKDRDRYEWIAPVEINGTVTPLKIDSGAQVNVLTRSDYDGLKHKPRIYDNTMRLKAYNNTDIETQGICYAMVHLKTGEKFDRIRFVIVDGKDNVTQSILGVGDSEKLGLVVRAREVHKVFSVKSKSDSTDGLTKDKVQKEYKDVFEGLGCLDGKVSIQLKDNAVPLVCPARKVPIALKDKLKHELNRLEQQGVIKKTQGPTDWVLPLVLVQKSNGDLRICMDPLRLNQYVKREHFHLPERSEIQSEMAGAKYFSKLDASQGFYNLQLDEKSTKLCTVATPFGRYSFLRMPFGIASAPEIFHAKIAQLFENIAGVKVSMDDIVTYAKTREEHDKLLTKVLGIIRKAGIKLNLSKCEIGVSELTFVGDRLTGEGIRPDPRKVSGIAKMPDPASKEDLRRGLGMVNYLAKFVPNMSVKSTNLRKLLLNDVEWQWTESHAKEWDQLKNTLMCEPILVYFDPRREIKVSSDASKGGLVAVLLQKHGNVWKPVAFASRAMTSAEKNYAQIEKELLGIVFAVEKFHEYVYGATAIAETDHKPLIALHQKNVCDLTPRLQRLMLRLRRYDLTLQFIPGKFLIVADTLSRAYPPEIVIEDRNIEKEIALHIAMIQAAKPFSDPMWDKIARETSKDETLRKVIDAIQNGWDCYPTLKPYYHVRADLTVLDGVILKSHKVVVPATLRAEIMAKIHEGHIGIEKCQARARQVVYWPNITRDIENFGNKCSVCLKYRYKQPKEPLQSHDVPIEPWSKLGVDLFHLFGNDFVVAIDYTSNYPEIAKLENLSSDCTIGHLKAIMARHGIPRTVVTDPGSQFYQCREFREFASEYGFEHVVSSPKHSQSNGKAEKGVQIVKRLLKKAKESDEDPYLALLSYRNTPLSGGKSPAEILMNRKLRDRLPDATGYQASKFIKPQNFKQKVYYDHGATALKPISGQDTVRIRRERNAKNCLWAEKAKVLNQVAPNSYRVLLENGQILRRNRRDLLKTSEYFQFTPEIPEDDNFGQSENVPIQGQPTNVGNTEQLVHPLPTPTVPNPVDNTVRISSRGRVIKPTKRFIEQV